MHISTKKGLPNNSVQDIFKDNKGYIWIGTNAGLCKYDGKQIHTYSAKDGLSGNYIWGIAQDKQGLLWLATYDNGICSFDGYNFTQLILHDSINKRTRCVVYDNDYDILLFGTDDGLIIKDGDSVQYYNGKSMGIGRFQVIAIQKIGELFYIYPYLRKDTYQYDPRNKKLQKFSRHNKRGFKNIASAIIPNTGDTVVGYQRDSVAILEKNTIERFGNTGQVFDMCKGVNNEVWLAGWDISLRGETGGLFQLKNNKLTDYTDKLQLKTRLIWSLYFDSLEKMLFVGTNDKGLYIFQNKIFQYYDIDKNPVHINYLKHIGNKLWIATDNGLLVFQNNKIVEKYDKSYFARLCKGSDDINIKRFYASQKSKLFANYISTDSFGNIYVSTTGGFFEYISSGHFRCRGEVSFPFVFDENKLWAVGWSQLLEYNTNDFRTIIKQHDYKKEETPIDIVKIIKQENRIWFLSNNRGLFLKEGGRFIHLNKSNKLLD